MHFLAADVEKITGVKRNRLQQWLERGFIFPSVQVASGHGTRNIWSHNDLYTIELFKQITESGFSRKMVSAFLATGQIDGKRKEIDRLLFLVFMRKDQDVKGIALGYDEDVEVTIELGDIQEKFGMKPFDDVYIVNFAKLRRRVDEKIDKKKS